MASDQQRERDHEDELFCMLMVQPIVFFKLVSDLYKLNRLFECLPAVVFIASLLFKLAGD